MTGQFPITRASTDEHEPNRPAAIISPSGISLFFCVLVGAAVPIWTALLTHYKNSTLQEQLIHLQSNSKNSGSYNELLSNTSNNVAGYLSDGLFWLIVGIVSLVALISIVKAVIAIYSVERELTYVNHSRSHIVHEALSKLSVSLLAVGTIVGLTVLLLKRITIWSIEQTNAAVQNTPLPMAILQILLIVLVLAGLLHVYVILMRLALLRTRLIRKL